MHILVDENIPYGVEVFTTLGTVQTFHGRHLSAADLATTDALIVRSITPVNEKLLAGTPVSFVGTATIGTDHVDLAYLQQRGIGFASAPGCNATSAAEYVISALTVLAQQQDIDITKKTVGIIGCGNVGSRVKAKLHALQVPCLIYDPPLQEYENSHEFVDLATVQQADILTLHVPLTNTGRYPTNQMVDRTFLKQLRDDVILLNTSRGQVIDEIALSYRLLAKPQTKIVLDVWRNEPHIQPLLLQQVALATPHIAGYSLDGKVRGTEMIYQAICDHFQFTPKWQVRDHLPMTTVTLRFSNQFTAQHALTTAILTSYDVRQDDAKLRLIYQNPQPAVYFDNLRKHYPIRREFHSVMIQLPQSQHELAQQFTALGFQTTLESLPTAPDFSMITH
jgi:erythronate-4-phosphate dehydrogenase